jgi:hypothetical protein
MVGVYAFAFDFFCPAHHFNLYKNLHGRDYYFHFAGEDTKAQ